MDQENREGSDKAAEEAPLFVHSDTNSRRAEERNDDQDSYEPVQTLQAKETGLPTSIKSESSSTAGSSTTALSTDIETILQTKELQTAELTTTIDQMKKKLAEQEARIKQLDKENERLKLEKASFVSTNPSDPKDNDSSQSDVKTADADNTTGAASLESDEGFKLIELESKIFDLERSLETANKRADDLETQRDAAVADREQAVLEAARFESRLQSQTEIGETVAKLESRIEALIAEETLSKNEKTKLESESRDKTALVETLQKDSDELRTKILKAESESSVNRERLDTLTSQKEAVEATLRQNLEKMLEMQRKLKEAEKLVIDTLNERIRVEEEHQKSIRELSATLNQNQKEMANVKDQMQQLEMSMTETGQRISQVEEEAAEARANVEQIQSEKSELKNQCDALIEKSEAAEKLLIEKSSKLDEATAAVDNLNASIEELELKIDQERRHNLEKENRWRQELDEAKTSLEAIKKENLDQQELIKTTENECKRLAKSLETKEAELTDEKQKGDRSLADVHKLNDAIQRYKAAIKEADSVNAQCEHALMKKSQEADLLQKDVQSLRDKYETSEKNFASEQTKCLRLKSELDSKTESEIKLKQDFATLQTQFKEKLLEADNLRKQTSDFDLRFQQSNQSNVALMGETKLLKSANEMLQNANESSKKDSQFKDAQISDINSRLATSKKLANDFQQMVTAKNKEVEEMNRTCEESRKAKEQLEVRFRNAEDERSSLVETVRQLKAENEKLKTENDKLTTARVPAQTPPGGGGGGGRKRTAKGPASSLDHDNAEEVEVTPMMASKPQKNIASRKKEETMKEEQPLDTDSGATGKIVKGRRGRPTTGRPQKSSDDQDDAASDATSASGTSGKSAPSTSPKPMTKAVPKKPKIAKDPARDSSMPMLDFPLMTDVPISNTGRPQRRAAQIASNGIAAVSEFWRNSVNPLDKTTTAAGTSTSTSAETAAKKRRREASKETIEPISSTTEEKQKKTTGEIGGDTITTAPLQKTKSKKKK